MSLGSSNKRGNYGPWYKVIVRRNLAQFKKIVWKTEKVNWHKTFDSRFDSKIVSINFLKSEVVWIQNATHILEKWKRYLSEFNPDRVGP